jgi:Zn-dependent membrane protease YugP
MQQYPFNGDGRLNDEVYAPAADKTQFFEPETDMWLVKLIYWGVGALVVFIFCVIGFVYDIVVFLAVPVGILALGVLLSLVAVWVWHDARKV